MKSRIDFEQVWNLYYYKVKVYISRHIEHWQDAEDIALDVFMSAYKHYDKFDPERASLITWLFTITQNALKNYYRRTHPEASPLDYDYCDLPSPDDVEQTALLEERLRILRVALNKLPEKQREAIEMRYFQNLSCEETAKRMDLTSGNVRVILNRARKRLGELLDDFKDK